MPDPRIPCTVAALDMNGTTIADNGAFDTALRDGLYAAGVAFPDERTLGELRGIANTALLERLVPDPDRRAAGPGHPPVRAERVVSVGRAGGGAIPLHARHSDRLAGRPVTPRRRRWLDQEQASAPEDAGVMRGTGTAP